MGKKKTAEQHESQKNTNNKTPEYKAHAKPEGVTESLDGDKSDDMKTKNPSVECTEINKEIYDKVVSEKEQLMEKLAEMQDKYIRLSAEYDNYRKRTLREKIDLSKHAGEEFFLKILPVMDDFERALAHLEQSNDFKSLKEGIELIYIKFTKFFKQSGVKEIDALNVPFDFELHDAVAKTPVEEEERKGKVVDVIMKGYYLQDKVIRHAKVVVGE